MTRGNPISMVAASAAGGPRMVLVLLVALGSGGCGHRGPVVAHVDGTVVLDGKPVEGATVSFTPAGADGLPAFGKTDAGGRFHLTSTRGGRQDAGAVVGSYAVAVSKSEYDLQGKPPPANDDYSAVPVRHHVPPAYGTAATSGLRADVKPGSNSVRFELTSSADKGS